MANGVKIKKKTTTHPCNGFLSRTLPPLCTPILAEFSAGICCAFCTFTQTFGKDRKKNAKFKMKSVKFFYFCKKNSDLKLVATVFYSIR